MKVSNNACTGRLGLAGALVVLAGTAVAQEIPQYDPAVHCKRLAEVSGKYSEVIYGACLDEEQVAFNALKPRWRTVPAPVRKRCDQLGRVEGAGLYTSLQTCLDQELSTNRFGQKGKG